MSGSPTGLPVTGDRAGSPGSELTDMQLLVGVVAIDLLEYEPAIDKIEQGLAKMVVVAEAILQTGLWSRLHAFDLYTRIVCAVLDNRIMSTVRVQIPAIAQTREYEA